MPGTGTGGPVPPQQSAPPPGPDLFADYMRDIVRRLTTDRDATIALFELRLEAMRRPEVAGVLDRWRREGFAGDVQFNTDAGLPCGPREIALFHYAIEGLVLDRLTGPLMPDTPTDDIIDDLVGGLLGKARDQTADQTADRT